MRTFRFFILSFLLAFILSSHTASAQRTAFGERFIEMDAHVTPHTAYGFSLGYGQYLLNAYWSGGLVAEDYLKKHQNGQPFGNGRLEARGAFMYRIFGTRNRGLSVYGGGDAFIGFELLDVFRQLDEPTWQSMLLSGYSSSRFIYGVSPRAEAEFFVLPLLAVTAGIRIPVTLNGAFKENLVDFAFGAGVRYNF